MTVERAWEPEQRPEDKAVDLYVQPAFYGLGKYAPPKKPARKPPAEKVVARTPDGQQPYDLVSGWASWMTAQTGVPPTKTMTSRLMAEVKELILTGYSASDIKWSLAIWSTKLAENFNTSPKELSAIAWKYRMDSSQAASVWRQRMKQSAQQMGKQGISPSALSSSPAEAKTQATRAAAQSWADRQKNI